MTDLRPASLLLTSDEVAALLGTTRGALHQGTRRGFLPCGTRIAGLGLRWRRADVEAWADQHFDEQPGQTRRAQ